MDKSTSSTVLIIDDEPGVLSTVSDVLEDEGYRTLAARSGVEGLELYRSEKPDVVFLDIWLPDRDGLEVLAALCDEDPLAAVVMISGHGTVSTAVKAIRMGAADYLEKPLSYNQVVEAVMGALDRKRSMADDSESQVVRPVRTERDRQFAPAPSLPLLREGTAPQRTLSRSTVIYGLGLHSGTRTGMVLQPLPPDSGIHFFTLPAEKFMPAHVGQVQDTDYATTLTSAGENIRTVEHLLSALHAYGVTNLLIKVHGEIPVLDGSSLEFCKVLEEAGLEDQGKPRQELVIDRAYEVSSGGEKCLKLEPYDGFRVSYLLRYPEPVGEQFFELDMTSAEIYREQIAGARTFGFMKDLAMMNELGLGSGGRLDNFILVGEDDVINTELRFPDEFVRHKILDIVGDLYLLGYPIRGQVTARLTGHRDNIAILREIQARNSSAE